MEGGRVRRWEGGRKGKGGGSEGGEGGRERRGWGWVGWKMSRGAEGDRMREGTTKDGKKNLSLNYPPNTHTSRISVIATGQNRLTALRNRGP